MNEEKRRIEREKITEEAVVLSMNNAHTLLQLATGTGKSKIALDCIAVSPSRQKWLLVCEETSHIDNWMREIEKWNLQKWWDENFMDAICYASLKHWNGINVNLLLDEVHNAGSFLRTENLSGIFFEQIISLSATVNDEIKEKLNVICPFVELSVSLSEAIQRGILPEPKIYVVDVELDEKFKDYEFKFGKKIAKLTAREYYAQLSKTATYWKDKYEEESLPWQKNKMMMSLLNRKRWLGVYKTPIISALVDKIRGHKFICFCSSVAQAKQLGGKRAVNSKNSKEVNQQIISSFNEGKADEIFSCQMLRESVTLEGIEIGIVGQLDSETLSINQMGGRILRSDNPIVFITVIKGTQDEKYLNRFLEEMDSKYITRITKNQIKELKI